MRETDKLCQEKFNGDMRETIKYILWHYQYDELDAFAKEWTKEEARIAYELVEEAPVVNPMPEEINGDQSQYSNPYIKKVIFQLIFMIVVIGILIVAEKFWVEHRKTIDLIISVFTGYMALSVGPNIVNIFRYRKENKV